MANSNGWQVTVGTSSTPVAPALSGYTAVSAETGTAYAAGAYVAMPNGRVYWTPKGGTYTTANAPTHTKGAETSADSIIWVAIKGSRRGLIISADLLATTHLSEGTAATMTSGVILDDARPWIQRGESSAAQYAIVSVGTATLTVEEL